MLIDDDPAFVEMVTAQLQIEKDRIGAVASFTSPAEALQRLETVAPDLALIDMVMPRMDGITCAETIRARRPQTLILLVTGVVDSRLAERARECRFNGFLAKPFTSQELHPCHFLPHAPLMRLQ